MPVLSADLTDKARWFALATGSAFVAGFAARNLLKAGWRVFADEDPPLNPASRDTDWAEAALWTVSTGIAAGLARLIARRQAATAWERLTGMRPPAFNKG